MNCIGLFVVLGFAALFTSCEESSSLTVSISETYSHTVSLLEETDSIYQIQSSFDFSNVRELQGSKEPFSEITVDDLKYWFTLNSSCDSAHTIGAYGVLDYTYQGTNHIIQLTDSTQNLDFYLDNSPFTLDNDGRGDLRQFIEQELKSQGQIDYALVLNTTNPNDSKCRFNLEFRVSGEAKTD